MTRTSLRPRPARVVPATIAAVVLILLGAALAVLAILRLQDGAWPSAATFLADAGNRQWGARSIAAGGGILALIGLVMVLCGILPGRSSSRSTPVPAAGESVETAEAAVTRRGTQHLVENRVRALDGVGSCSARLSGTKLSVTVRTPLREHDELARAVQTVTDDVLAANLDGRIPKTNVRMVSTS
ncbi:hypothetical protein GCM10009596_21030 [Arthrobacter rhombi]|uniref:DUF6286 domain-containing protein n=1 Tax=Arthrobacter rhombi TaxID=71253 RepID=UPI0031DFCA0B